MRYYIVDDDMAIVQSLEYIISECKLGEVVGSSTNSFTAMEEILDYKPDIVLVDFLMSGMDGVKLVKKIREKLPNQTFVMLSKVTDKGMIQQAYSAGIELFISKPISIIEVQKVLTNVSQKIQMQGIMNNLQNLFGGSAPIVKGQIQPQVQETLKVDTRKLNILFGELGILGERGLQDIRAIYTYMTENSCDYDKSILDEVAVNLNDTVKNVEQRVRRALRKGLTNAATACLSDIDSDAYIYANYVYNITSLKDEMDYIKGNSHTGGRVSISRFMEGLMLYSENV